MLDVRAAMRETIDLARSRGMEHHEDNRPAGDLWLTWSHLLTMQRNMRMHAMMDTDKLNRWLGWAQCAVVASGLVRSDEMAEINRRNTE